jgi:hypothetical protein
MRPDEATLVHLEEVWKTVRADVPELLAFLDTLVPPENRL